MRSCLRLAAVGLLSWFATLALAGEAAPRPELPDPYGLGERLVLIDYLREHGVVPPENASLDELYRLYAGLTKPEPAIGTPEEERLLAQDRMRRMRQELKDRYGAQPPETASEDDLQRLLGEFKAAATDQTAQAAIQQAALSDRPLTPEEAKRRAEVAGGNLTARMEQNASALSDERQRLAACDQQRDQAIAAAKAAKAHLDELNAALGQLRNAYAQATQDYNRQAIHNNVSVSDVAKKRLTQADAAQRDGLDAVDRQKAVLAERLATAEEWSRQHAQHAEVIAKLDQERVDLARQLKEAQKQAAAPVPAVKSPPTPVPPATGQEARLKAAVVLVGVEGRGSGTGFFVSADGLLITNAHVVGDGKLPMFALWDGGAKHAPVRLRLVQLAAEADLALLRAEAGDAAFQALELRELYGLATPVLAAGFPLAGGISQALGTSPSDIVLSRGALTAIRHQGETVEWLQHDCRIASGSSGGPLIDQESGAVVGINTMVLAPDAHGGAGDGMNLAIPIRKVRERFGALIK
jgi:S1-C subfamily serine protease